MRTVPGVRMRRRDTARLAGLVRRFEHADAAWLPDAERTALIERLRERADDAARRPTRRSLVLFVDAQSTRAVTLPQPVYDRVVLDEHFDRRDLEYAAQFHPPFRVFATNGNRPLLFDSHADTLVERRLLPAWVVVEGAGDSLARHTAELVREIDDADPRPLVLARCAPMFASRVVAAVQTFVGCVDESAAERRTLHRAARVRVVRWCEDRARTALPPANARHWSYGSLDVQRAVAVNPRGTLVVEANHNDRFDRGVLVVDPGAFGFRHVGLNAAIARVRAGGGSIHFVPDGDMRDHGGVAYTTSGA
jgi:hypothetical protein